VNFEPCADFKDSFLDFAKLLFDFLLLSSHTFHPIQGGAARFILLVLKTSTMSINSSTGLMTNYSPLADRSPSSEDEKDIHARLQPDVEVGHRQNASERKPSRFIDGRTVSDAIIGLSDGMTVPFALTAGLSALGDTKVVVFGGLAELIAGAISMGLGGYLGAKSEE
jgi:hypothetical protein